MDTRLPWLLPWMLIQGLLWLPACAQAAEELPNWRLFTARDGLAESHISAVTLSPRGTIWLRHGDGVAATRLDGYEARTIPSPGEGRSPVLESRTGQIWCLAEDGFLEFSQGRWNRYPLAEIRAENAANLRRRVHPIPVVPAERDHVFFLLPSGLCKFDAGQNRVQIIRRADEAGVGSFLDMGEARDGGLFISANTGLLRTAVAVRRLTVESRWEEHPLPPAWGLSGLDRPIEDEEGGVTVSAVAPDSRGRRVLARLSGRAWELVTPDLDRLRQGWRSPDGSFWAVSRERLVRFERGQTLNVLRSGTLAGYHNDVAVGTNGVFWIATHEGLLLYNPRPWRNPIQMAGVNTPIAAMVEDDQGWLWFLAGDGLRAVQENQSQHHPWPDDVEPSLQPTDRLFILPDGRLIFGLGERVLLYDPKASRFQEHAPLPGRRAVRLLGQLRDGFVAILTVPEVRGEPGGQIERFDGVHAQTLLPWKADSPLGSDIVFTADTVSQDLWIGSGNGIGLLREGRLQMFSPAQGYTGGRASSWLPLGEGRFWCGAMESILEFDGRTWTVVRSGFDRVHALHRSRDGSVWVASGNGLHRFFRDSWVVTGMEEGLPSLAVLSVTEDQRGRIWAGTTFGLSRYHPRTDLDAPRTVLSLAPGETDVARKGAIRFVVNGVDKWQFTLPSRLLFSHRLDGGLWRPYSLESTIALQDLGPGKHVLQVRAMDRDWNVDPKPASVEFLAVVPWYRVPSMVVLMGIAAALILLLAWLAINRHLRLVRSYAEIEQIVEERTAALHRANQELLHSQKMKALGTLAAGVAHDFNQILSIIKGSAQIIEGNLANPDKIRTRTQRIQTVVDQGSGIVRAMLGLSRQEPGDLSPCDVNTIVREVVKLLGDRFLQEVTVKLDLQRGLPQVRASDDLVQQMLLNLAVNAADAMGGRGEITLRTALLTALPEGLVLEPTAAPRYVAIAVVDHGCGIAPEVLPRIFEPFFTTKALSTRRGTGLGLSMVYEFAKDIGGGLRVESDVNTGSTFTILLPVVGQFSRPGQ